MTASTDLPHKHSRRLAVGAVTLALLAAGATGVALAADSSSSPSTSSTPSPSASGPATKAPQDGPRDGQRGLRHGPGIGGPLGALHGEFVVPDGSGGYQTMLVQHGTVSAVSKTSISVKSADGFTKSYAVPADALVNAERDGLSSIDKGADVTVLAEEKGGTATATRVMDLSRLGDLRGRLGGHGPGRGPGPGTGSGSDSGTGSGTDSGTGSSTGFGV
jgi:hypothetical protein